MNEKVKLNNNIKMPALGLGVYNAKDHDELVTAIIHAIKAGYRSIDTAAIYGNEEAVGEGIRKALAETGLKREDLFITSKVWNDEMRSGQVVAAYEESLKKLDLEYLDLYLLHWPVPGKYQSAWLALEGLYKEGKVRSIGVSNFQIHHLKELAAISDTTPVVNQIECHPYLTQEPLRSYMQKQEIQAESWSPLMRGELLMDPLLVKLAEKYKKTVAQMIIRWNVQSNIVVIPKSTNKARLEENYNVFDFHIDSADMVLIDSLNQDKRMGQDPDNVDF